MTKLRRRLRCWALAWAVASGALLSGQEVHVLAVRYGERPTDELTVRAHLHGAPARPGGWTWLDLQVHNPDDRPHDVVISLISSGWRSGTVESQVEFRVEPNTTRSRILPLVGTQSATRLQVVADGYRMGWTSLGIPDSSDHYGFRGLMISEVLSNQTDWESALRAATAHIAVGHIWDYSGSTRKKVARHAIRSLEVSRPSRVPEQWRLLSGYDFVLLDCGSELSAPLQQALVDYTRAGGNTLLLESSALDQASILGRVVESHFEEVGGDGIAARGRLGFGGWLAVGRAVEANQFATLVMGSPVLEHWFEPEGAGAFRPRPFSGPSPAEFMPPGTGIPGVGEVSRGLFLFLICGFAVVVGPINYLFWRRRRQLAMLLLTVPVAGFAFTGVTLLWGLLADGLGIQGVLTTVTILDQRTHDAVSWSAERLYAGLTPDALRPRAGTWVGCDELTRAGDYRFSAQNRFELALPAGRLEIGGQAVPARSMTHLRTVSVGTERARLRFVRTDGGASLARIEGSSFAPEAQRRGRSAIVVRDPSGRYFVGSDGGSLQSLAADRVADTLAALWLPCFAPNAYATDRLPPGSYLAHTDFDPARDDLGLSVEWHERRHLVFGWLAEEDIRDAE